jgi:hypothetical protein
MVSKRLKWKYAADGECPRVVAAKAAKKPFCRLCQSTPRAFGLLQNSRVRGCRKTE